MNKKQAESVAMYLVVWSNVGKVDVGVHSQADPQPSSLPANSRHLLPRHFEGSLMLFKKDKCKISTKNPAFFTSSSLGVKVRNYNINERRTVSYLELRTLYVNDIALYLYCICHVLDSVRCQ